MEEELKEANPENIEKIGQNQFYDIVTGRQPDWQTIIYDLVHTEQLDPWDIDIIVLTSRYFEKIYELEEKLGSDDLDSTDFYISSKVLFAAALLLRIKSDFLLNKHIKSIDEILFGKKQESRYEVERIEIDEDELPLLIPRTPLPRQRKVTLDELMAALNSAINTESRRIKREVAIKRAKKLSEVDFHIGPRIDLKDRIRQFYAKILTSLKKTEKSPKKHLNKIAYSELIGNTREEKLACFLPVLHLSNARKLWVEQENHLDEIWIYLYEFFKKHPQHFVEEIEQEIEEMQETGEISEERTEAMKEIARQVAMLFKEVTREEKIEEVTGFGDE